MSKNITFSDNTRQKLKQGVDKIADAVKATLGPKGRNVIIETTYGTPHITKDGVTVAKSIELKDSIENLAAQVIKQAAQKTVLLCGDGTTTAIVLAQAIFNEAYKLVQSSVASPIDIKRSVDSALPNIIASLEKYAIKINDNSKRIEEVATISANNDQEIGKFIAEAFSLVGEEGVVHVEESKYPETYIEETKGAQLDRGYVSPYFINNPQKLTCELVNPYILIYDKKLRAAQDIVPALQLATKQARPLLVIAEEIEAQALSLLIINKMKANLPVVAIKAPAFGDRRTKVLEDIAILTKGQVMTESVGKLLKDVTIADFGEAEKIIVSKADTTIIGGKGSKKSIEERIQNIKAEIEASDSDYDKQKNKERVAMLNGKVAILHVGAPTEVEFKEKKDRVDDAVQATQSALKMGIVSGGGTEFFRLSLNLDKSFIGQRILAKALQAPLKTICENAGVSSEIVMQTLEKDPLCIYNALTNSYEALTTTGVIDPALVLISALKNAVSVATTLLLTEVTITEEPHQNNEMQHMPTGLDEEMY